MRKAERSLEISRSVRCAWREPHAHKTFATGVSLHSHTLHSRETLDFIPRVLRAVGPAHAALEALEARHRRKTGKSIPFERAFWRPPLHPHAAYDLEVAQIRSLGLEPLVSITDHDSVESCAELDTIGIHVPYSTEWSIPYHGTVFHVGVHNLPAEQARAFESDMAAITAAPRSERIQELLAALSRFEQVLLILNHPFSCEGRVAQAHHVELLQRFLEECCGWIHAFELNGLQPLSHNLDTIRLADEWGVPVISGGDRHCCEPNANLNLTNARTFGEFVSEIRVEQRSSVLFMPQYRDPIPARYIEFMWHAVRDYPDFSGRMRWLDRVFFIREKTGENVPIAEEWTTGGPLVIRAFVAMVGLLASPWMRAVFCSTMGRIGDLEPEVS